MRKNYRASAYPENPKLSTRLLNRLDNAWGWALEWIAPDGRQIDVTQIFAFLLSVGFTLFLIAATVYVLRLVMIAATWAARNA